MVQRRGSAAGWRKAYAGAVMLVPAIGLAADETPLPVQIEVQVQAEAAAAKEAAKEAAKQLPNVRARRILLLNNGGGIQAVAAEDAGNAKLEELKKAAEKRMAEARANADRARDKAQAEIRRLQEEIQALDKQDQVEGKVAELKESLAKLQEQAKADAERMHENAKAQILEAQKAMEARLKEAAAGRGAMLGGVVGARNGRHYMLGVVTTPASPALRAQLKLAEGEGLVVEHLLPNSAAAKAGLKQYDVVTKINGTAARTPTDLMRIVAESADKNVKLDLVREGKPESLEIKPEERKEDAAVQPQQWNFAIPQAVPGAMITAEGDVVIQRIAPFGGGNLPALAPLPQGIGIQVNREGDKPAKIKVTLDGKTYDVTEDKLDDLPESVRPHVSRMLGKDGVPRFQVQVQGPGGVAFGQNLQAAPFGGGLRGVQPVPVAPAAPGVDPAVVQELKKEVQAMRKALEELRKDVQKD